MDVAFVEHAEHDVDGEQRRQDQPRLTRQRCLKRTRRPLERAMDTRWNAELGHHRVDHARRIGQRHVGRQIERDRRRRELPLMVDGERCVRRSVPRECRQRNLRAARCIRRSRRCCVRPSCPRSGIGAGRGCIRRRCRRGDENCARGHRAEGRSAGVGFAVDRQIRAADGSETRRSI